MTHIIAFIDSNDAIVPAEWKQDLVLELNSHRLRDIAAWCGLGESPSC